MLNRIDFSERKSRIWDNTQILDLTELNPDNLEYIITPDESVFVRDEKKNYSPDFNEVFQVVDKSLYLKLLISNMYYFYKCFGVKLTSHMICNALNVNVHMLNKICMLFKSVILDESYPITMQDKTVKKIQSLQITGLSKEGILLAEKLTKNDCLRKLYSGNISNDFKETACFRYVPDDKSVNDKAWQTFVDNIMSDSYLKVCGTLNVSVMSIDELNHSGLCKALFGKTQELYLLNYDLEFNGASYFVKYLHWL
ncbi:MAG: hypothetical protein IIZ07_07940 [Ruminococcus sp.]|nr:hypothetical protein [Ruminococcus sp.]